MSDKFKVFLSYSRRDLAVADALVVELEAKGIQVLIDRRDLPYGEQWQSELADFIRNADAAIWLVSSNSVDSKWVGWELGELLRLNKKVIPIRIQAIDAESLPSSLGKIHILPADAVFDAPTHLTLLLSALHTNQAWLKDATRLLDRARQWHANDKSSDFLLRGDALAHAVGWSTKRPKDAPPVHGDVLELLMASRHSASRRQRYWIGGAFLAAVTVVMLAGLTFFFQADSTLNNARAALEAGQVENAQAQFAGVAANPLVRHISPASARALASALLDFGSVKTLLRLTPPGGLNPRARHSLIVSDGRLFGLLHTISEPVLFACHQQSCSSSNLGASWTESILVRDGSAIYLLKLDSSKGNRVARAALIKMDGSASLPDLDVGSLAPLREVGKQWMWVGDGFVRNLTAPSNMLSESPPLANSDNIGGVPVAIFDDKSSHNAGSCAQDFSHCVTMEPTDARSTNFRFDVWTGKRQNNSTPPKVDLREKISTIFWPFRSRNVRAISPNGAFLAISEDNVVRVWDLHRSSERDKNAFRTFVMDELVLALQFDTSNRSLFVLQRTGVKLVNFNLRVRPTTSAARPPAADVPETAWSGLAPDSLTRIRDALEIGADQMQPSFVAIQRDKTSEYLLAYLKQGKLTGSSGSVNVARLRVGDGKVEFTSNGTEDFFDLISWAKFSPSGRFIMTYKQSSARHQLFRTSDLRRFELPGGMLNAWFSDDDSVVIEMKSGAWVRLDLPEAHGREVTHLDEALQRQ